MGVAQVLKYRYNILSAVSGRVTCGRLTTPWISDVEAEVLRSSHFLVEAEVPRIMAISLSLPIGSWLIILLWGSVIVIGVIGLYRWSR
jgi:hypothetical protein